MIYLLIVLVIALAVAWQWHNQTSTPAKTKNNPSKSTVTKTKPSVAPTHPVDEASSIWVVVNKGRVLSSGYVPTGLVVPKISLRQSGADEQMQLRSDAATALEQMTAAAKPDGANLMLASGYRSYGLQVATYDSEVKAYGQAKADSESARPGHSEHQTGLAADLEPTSRQCEVADCFADTTEGKWLAANAYKFGFVIRYQKDNQNLTGYRYEPWHIRFIGVDLATKIHNSNQTLEQYFNLPAYIDYPATSTQLKG